MLIEGLRMAWPQATITYANPSRGGTTSEWGLAELENNCAGLKPDLAILAFGMNDGSAKTPADRFASIIEDMMDGISKNNADCEYLLVATMIPNRDVCYAEGRENAFYGTQDDFLPALNALKKEGVALADMTTMHHSLLTRKRYTDMTGNIVNHPNDFLARVYAQVMLATLK